MINLEITTKKLNENYLVEGREGLRVVDSEDSKRNTLMQIEKKYKIYVEKDIENETMSIRNINKKYQFMFMDSTPEAIRAIAQLLLRASEIDSNDDCLTGAPTPLTNEIKEAGDNLIKKINEL